MSIFRYLGHHLLVVALILVIGYLFFSQNTPSPIAPLAGQRNTMMGYDTALPEVSNQAATKFSTAADRIVLQETTLSLLVDNVRGISDQIIAYAKQKGGFMVNASFSRPEESPYASVTVRVPTSSLDETLTYLRGLAVKVSSENIVGTDVTDQHQDLEVNLATLNKTQAKLNTLLDEATRVEDILNVQRELSNVQQQIDSIKGQKELLEKSAAFTKITVFLSTDELALPYVPDKSFRPNLIFKQAVRSLVDSFRSLGEFGIWVAVYSAYWIPALVLIYFLRKRFNK